MLHTQSDKTSADVVWVKMSEKRGGRRLWGCPLADVCWTYRAPHHVTEFYDLLTSFTTLTMSSRFALLSFSVVAYATSVAYGPVRVVYETSEGSLANCICVHN